MTLLLKKKCGNKSCNNKIDVLFSNRGKICNLYFCNCCLFEKICINLELKEIRKNHENKLQR